MSLLDGEQYEKTVCSMIQLKVQLCLIIEYGVIDYM